MGQARPVMRQGFVGRCRYTFSSDAPEDLCRSIAALAGFAEFSGGVSSSVAHGCGAVAVQISEGKT
jgi:CRISPR-associated endoribonuclease Cas6